ncbi:hypothetical protein GE061_005664 [Apolygus lucorum]|uniref:Uncharacterized protein n=1 Tax=Apolygus lucorum TaxID=248454 RepID=A0A8S9WWX1_APOLU|nr:hypothetical protein GE061_005664 [Apolygus lucorum]
MKALPTAKFDTPPNWGRGFDVPYGVILYQYDDLYHPWYGVGNKCGGVLMTTNVVMTLCVCVATYISFRVHRIANHVDFAVKDTDLGPSVFVTAFETDYFKFPKNIKEFTKKGSPTRFKLVDKPDDKVLFKKEQQCFYVFDKATADNKLEWLQRTTFALVKFEPTYKSLTLTPSSFPAWPPQPIPYDLTLKEKGFGQYPTLWGVHRAKGPQTVVIPSYNFRLSGDKKPNFKDEFGVNISFADNRLHLRTTLCDQDLCAQREPTFANIVFKSEPKRGLDDSRRKYIGCYCDVNDFKTVCGGQVASPVIHEGNLMGLLTKEIECRIVNPRTIIVAGMDPVTISHIYYSFNESLTEKVELDRFRSKSGLVDNYELEIPMADLMPQKLEITKEDLPEGLSGSYTLRPSTLLLYLLLFLFT